MPLHIDVSAARRTQKQRDTARLKRAADLHSTGKLDQAEKLYQDVLAQQPSNQDALRLYGILNQQRRRYPKAVEYLEQAVALKPDDHVALQALGIIQLRTGQIDQAQDNSARALSLAPDDVNTNVLAGLVHRQQGNPEQALALYDRALEISPDHAEARYNRASTLLLLGRMKEGWQAFEARWENSQGRAFATNFTCPQWDGANLDGRTLLIHPEQGHGDYIQMARFLPTVVQQNGTIILECKNPIERLIQSMNLDIEVVTTGTKPEGFDLHCPIMSLPLALNTELSTIPNTVPYFAISNAEIRAASKKLPNPSGLKVGLVWQGSASQLNNQLRSISLSRLAPLFDVAGIQFFSLQMTSLKKRRPELDGAAVVDLGNQLGDFADTAAIIHNLDLVITVDTAFAHLTGALAKPVWTLLRYSPDWRWMLDRDDSPWYPTMRLFRQPSPGDWPAVIARVQSELTRLATGDRSGLLPDGRPQA